MPIWEVPMNSVFTRASFLSLLCLMTTALLLLGATTVGAQPSGCPTGMTGFWRFDESIGGPYDDYYGINDAICTNCPATATGKLGNAIDFDGVNDRVDIPDDGSLIGARRQVSRSSSGCGQTDAVAPKRDMTAIR